MENSLFEKLTLENQTIIQSMDESKLMDSLKSKNHFIELNARDLFELSELFNLNKYDISFTSAMLQISNLFKS